MDLDGTFFSSKGLMIERNINAVTAAKNRGCFIVVSTGRPARGVSKELIETVGADYVIALNGASVYDVKNEKVICKRTFDKEYGLSLFRELNQINGVAEIFTPENGYLDEHKRPVILSLPVSEEIRKYFLKTRTFVGSTEDTVRNGDEEIEKVTLHLVTDDSGRVLDKELAEDIISRYTNAKAVSCGGNTIEITSLKASKGQALEFLSGHLGIGMKEVMAIGDTENDLDAIEKAGIGVAMGNAEDIVKKSADYITEDNDLAGFALAVGKFILGESS